MKLLKLIFILFFFTIVRAEITISESSGLFNIVDKEYKHCSPLQGMIWWRSNLIENMYRIGNRSDSIIQFIRLLFYLHYDGTFDCTRKPKVTLGNGNSAAYFTAEVIAEFIYLLEKNNTIALINILKNKITKKSYIKNFLESHQEIFPESGNFIKNLKKVFSLFCESYKECLGSVYEKYTLHNILLAYMWKRSKTKDDFVNYFNVFSKPDFELPVINQENKLSLNRIASAYYEPNLLKQFFIGLSYRSLYEILDQYELVICSCFYNKSSLLLQTESQVIYKEENFADCGEILILNFFNILIFNPKKERFDIEILEKKELALEPKMVNFYKKYNSPDLMRRNKVHSDWAIVVSEIPNVVYRQPYNCDNKSRYCNISGIGYHQLITIFNHLLGLVGNNKMSNVDQLENIVLALSREDFKLTYKFAESPDNLYNTIIFFINSKPSFACVCKDSHFLLYLVGMHADLGQLFSLNILDYLTKNYDSNILSSLLLIDDAYTILGKLIKNRSTTVSLLNFAIILPKLDTIESKKQILKIISNNYVSLKKDLDYKNLHRLISIIKNIYLETPPNYLILNALMKIVILNKIEDLYLFMKDEVHQFIINKNGNFYPLIVDIIVKIYESRDQNLYEWKDQLMDIIKGTKYFLLAETLMTKL